MFKDEIIEAIFDLVDKPYNNWYIGVTSDGEQAKKKHDNPSTWKHWECDSAEATLEIEKRFSGIGMAYSEDNVNPGNFVYVFQMV